MTDRPKRQATATSNFGVSRREGHDASGFYARFPLPVLSADDTVVAPYPLPDDGCFLGDSRVMDDRVADGSVALVVTSPPYFAGKAYEEELGEGHIPSSYVEYLELLRDVFAACVRKLEPGGRIAVNVANLGRKPYRSLSADVTGILMDLGLLLRGEVIWRKAEGAGGNCAWGSFASPSNPVLRDLTERVVIASKGRFDRAHPAPKRAERGLPHEPHLLTNDEFMEATLDVWDIPPESAKRVNHPAPFPVELPERLIKLYTYRDDLVLDPFLGSGSTLVAAARTGRRGAGYDMDPDYVELARQRVQAEAGKVAVDLTGARAIGTITEELLVGAGFTDVRKNVKVRGTGLALAFVATDALGAGWCFDLSGAFTTMRSGLHRSDAVWRAIGRAHVLAQAGHSRVVLLTSHLPRAGTDAARSLRAAGPTAFQDALEVLDPAAPAVLRCYAEQGAAAGPRHFWAS